MDARNLSNLAREDAEAGLSLVALLLFRNEPKSDSAAAIAELRSGGVECVMVRAPPAHAIFGFGFMFLCTGLGDYHAGIS